MNNIFFIGSHLIIIIIIIDLVKAGLKLRSKAKYTVGDVIQLDCEKRYVVLHWKFYDFLKEISGLELVDFESTCSLSNSCFSFDCFIFLILTVNVKAQEFYM